MFSSCANLATHAVRLRDAQREFFLAWKAVESGDRGTLVEARTAQRELEGVHRDIERTLYAAWTPKALESVERKKNLRRTHTMEKKGDYDIFDMQFTPDGHLLVTYIHPVELEKVRTRIVRRSTQRVQREAAGDELIISAYPFHRSILCPDRSLIALGGDGFVRFDLNAARGDRTTFTSGKLSLSTLHAHYDGRVFTGDAKGQVHIWTPSDDGSYTETLVKVFGHAVKGMHVFADGSFAIIDHNGVLSYWKQHESDDGKGNDWEMPFQYQGDVPGYFTAMHASLDGRLAVGNIFCDIEVYDLNNDGSWHFVRTFPAPGEPLALQVLPDHSIVAACADGTVNVWEPDDNEGYRLVEHTTQLHDDARIETANIAVNEQGLIAVVFNETDIHVLNGNPHVSSK